MGAPSLGEMDSCKENSWVGLSISLHLELLPMDLVYALSVCLTHWTEGSETEEPGQVVAEEALGRRPGPTPSTDTCKSMNGTQAE